MAAKWKAKTGDADAIRAPIADGYALPRWFEAIGTHGDVTVTVRAEVDDRRVRVSRVCVDVPEPHSVTSDILRAIPARDLVGSVARERLHEVRWNEKGTTTITPITGRPSPDALQALRGAIPWLGGSSS